MTVAEAHCPECDYQGVLNLEDFGIGSYEYWGAKGTHRDFRWACPVCGIEIPTDIISCEEEYPYDDDPRV